jgi:hypothetical protein
MQIVNVFKNKNKKYKIKTILLIMLTHYIHFKIIYTFNSNSIVIKNNNNLKYY